MISDERPDESVAGHDCGGLPCARCGRRSGGACPLTSPGGLAPYRLVARYRGDRVGRSFRPQEWDSLGLLAAGDPSWPPARPN